MRASKVAVVGAALTLAASMSVVPLQVAGAQSPSTSVLVPANGATVSGSQVTLDASASAGVTPVYFVVTGGSLSNSAIRPNATTTLYGWITSWNSTTVANGTYSLQSVAIEGSSTTTSPSISITVNNPPPSVSIVLPPNGATVSGTVVFDAFATPGATNVDFALSAPGCPTRPPSIVPVCDLGNATPTLYGWLLLWSSTSVPNVGVAIAAQATYGNGEATIAGPTSLLVANPAPTVVVPANGSTLSGTQVLDCVPPSFTEAPVSFYVLGRGVEAGGDATPTYYGWLYEFDTTSVANGVYTISCSATYGYGASGSGASISVTVAN